VPAAFDRRGDRIVSTSPRVGLGADDRAGCALLWLLKELGHGLLLTDGEEQGRLGSRYLHNRHPDAFGRINADHAFMVQFDRRGDGQFKTYEVGTDNFRDHVARMTGYAHQTDGGSTDITVLSERICGVNLSVGYGKEHTRDEFLDLGHWLRTLRVAADWLAPVITDEFVRA
jgi:hypothetical protein